MTIYPVIILGGSGYVAGEMLRLVAGHPALQLAGAVSTSLAGQPIAATFGHLRTVYPSEAFIDFDAAESLLARSAHNILLSAAPHGASAALINRMLEVANSAGTKLTVVDASADFRFRDADSFAAVYGTQHPAPDLLDQFVCAVPEHAAQTNTPHAAHPGCFATTMLLGIVPLLANDLAEASICVSAVTGSTGAGRKPRDTTHHPERQSNMFAYQVLKHRHAPEVEALAKAASGTGLELHFVPHSGPFARGIHATIFAKKRSSITTKAQVIEALSSYYTDAKLVNVLDSPPRMKDVAGSCSAALSADVDGDTIVVTSVLDNLLKGASGGCVQWLNRLLGLPETLGITNPSIGWL